MEQDKVSRLSDVGKNVQAEIHDGRKPMEQTKKTVSLGQRWDQARATKKVVFWFSVASIILTMIVGFNWGGWVTGGTAKVMAQAAVVQRLAPICVSQFNQDPEKERKLVELKDTSTWQRRTYIEKQGWATMSGEAKPDSQVAEVCAKLLVSQ